jgi:trehalose synthase
VSAPPPPEPSGPPLEEYREVAPPGTVDFLRRLSERVRGRRLLHVSATRAGGGVAEILHRLVPLLQDVGVKARWETLPADDAFLAVGTLLHRTLQGADDKLGDEELAAYAEGTRRSARDLSLHGDMVIIHDPPPAGLVEVRPQEGVWVWRCHADVSRPQRRAWSFLRQFVVKYDAAVYSLPKFAQRLPIPQFLITPSIDPLSDKNRELSRVEVDRTLERLGVPQDKPILLQVSRFDRFKDPLGVIDAYRIVKKRDDCRLVLVGGGETDDPEGEALEGEVREAASHDRDIHVLELPPEARVEVNALQRAATVVLQKSTKEGCGLTVAEAMWKGKPVVGGFAGGITMQIIYDVTGYTVNSVEGAAFRIRQLLGDPALREQIGRDAREYVRHNFLITRHLGDELALMAIMLRG